MVSFAILIGKHLRPNHMHLFYNDPTDETGAV